MGLINVKEIQYFTREFCKIIIATKFTQAPLTKRPSIPTIIFMLNESFHSLGEAALNKGLAHH